MNMRQKFELALKLRGESIVTNARSFKYLVMTRKAGGFYYLGASGALRFGPKRTASIPCSDKFKSALLAEADNFHQTGVGL